MVAPVQNHLSTTIHLSSPLFPVYSTPKSYVNGGEEEYKKSQT